MPEIEGAHVSKTIFSTFDIERLQPTAIIEFKCNQHSEAALQQIHDKGCAEPYRADGKPIILIGIEFSPEQSNITAWKVERCKT